MGRYWIWEAKMKEKEIIYTITPIYEANFHYFEYNYEHENQNFTTKFVQCKNRSCPEDIIDIIETYMENEKLVVTFDLEKIVDVIINPNYSEYPFSGLPVVLAFSKCEYNKNSWDRMSIYLDNLYKSLLIAGYSMLYSKHYRFPVKDNTFYYSGWSTSLRVEDFSLNLKGNSVPNSSCVDKIVKMNFMLNEVNEESNLTRMITLAIDYFTHSYAVRDSRIAYINLVMIIELFFKWHKDETANHIKPRLANFIHSTIREKP